MDGETTTFSLTDYLEIAWRRKWFIVLPFVVVMPIAIALCFVLPKIYEASSTIIITSSKVPDNFIRTTVNIDYNEYLNVISSQINSWTMLEKTIQDLSLFPDLINKVPLENLIAIMRKNISIQISSGQSISSFTVSYRGKNRKTVAAVTNHLVSLFIEVNMRSRKKQAIKTTKFLTSELEKLNVTLAEHEKTISDFKQRYIGSLPENQDANLRMLDQLIMQRQRISDEITDLENRKLILQQQPFQSGNIFRSVRPGSTALPSNPIQSQINEIQSRLTVLQNKYTENHPDVVAAKAELNNLTSQIPSTGAEKKKDVNDPLEKSDSPELLALHYEIQALKNEDILIKEKVALYQSRVELAPKLEQQLTLLSRDYENTKDTYDSLLRKKLAAEQAEIFETDKQLGQFKILDPAQVPVSPVKPDLQMILLIGLMVSCGLAGGIVFLLEFLDDSFYSVRDLESYLELPVLVSIPQQNFYS